MKYYLFVDNFRGFSQTCVPFTDVNFLVGENSTGKTSILSLVKLLSSPQFLFTQSLNDEYVNFGNFSDMVSAHSNDRSYFRIGAVWERSGSKKDESPATGWLLTYVEDAGLPRLSQYTFCRGLEKITLRLGKSISYKRETYDRVPTADSIVSSLLPQWITEHANGDTGYQKLALPSGFRSHLPVLIALSMVRSEASDGTKPKDKARSQGEYGVFEPSDIPFFPEVAWIAPIRTKPRRTYDELKLEFSPEGTHTPYLIRNMLKSKSTAAGFRSFIQKIGKASGLFQNIQTKTFGRETTAPFEIDIVLDGKPLNLNTVGYGVSQSLPVLVEISARGPGSQFAIQQPEVHLHPRAQAALGDVIFEMATTERKRFLIETHSDFMIDRFRMNYRSEVPQKPNSQILFFERQDNHNVVMPMAIDASGELPTDQPNSYREFFIKEELKVLGI